MEENDEKWNSRTERILGKTAIERLEQAHIAIFGVGGVGGYALEALARSGIGTISIIDADEITLSNLNRQIIALRSTLNLSKVETAKKRILDINPNCKVFAHKEFFLPENSDKFDFTEYDYILDCIDTVSGKIEIIKKANEANVPVISAMGAGNKLDGSRFRVADIYSTSVCPLARIMRRELKKRGIEKLKVVFSDEMPISVNSRLPGSLPFVPGVVGLIMAGEVVREIAEIGK